MGTSATWNSETPGPSEGSSRAKNCASVELLIRRFFKGATQAGEVVSRLISILGSTRGGAFPKSRKGWSKVRSSLTWESTESSQVMSSLLEMCSQSIQMYSNSSGDRSMLGGMCEASYHSFFLIVYRM